MSRPVLDPVWPLTVGRGVEQGPGSDSERLLCVSVWGAEGEMGCFSRYKLFSESTCAKKATRTVVKSLFFKLNSKG